MTGSDIVICGYAVQTLICGAPADSRCFFCAYRFFGELRLFLLTIFICRVILLSESKLKLRNGNCSLLAFSQFWILSFSNCSVSMGSYIYTEMYISMFSFLSEDVLIIYFYRSAYDILLGIVYNKNRG